MTGCIPDYECLKCNSKSSTQSNESYVSFPNLLMCNLLRFPSSSGNESKDCSSMFFPQSIYLQKNMGVISYCYPSFVDHDDVIHIDHGKYIISLVDTTKDTIFRTCVSTDSVNDKYSNNQSLKKLYPYNLKTKIHHIGSSIQDGHYVVDVLPVTGSKNIWLRYNNEIVTEIPESTVFSTESQSTNCLYASL